MKAPVRTRDGGTGVASHRIAARVREDILSGTLRPGERIRQEEIAAREGSSRLPVREALRILESQGLVQLKANTGAWVSKLDLSECQAIYKMRERLEPLALAESIPNLDAGTIERLESLQEEIEANTDLDRFLALDRELHILCYEGNSITELNQMVERFWNATQSYRRAFVRVSGPERMWIVNAEHRLLLEAIRRGDTADGERFLVAHIRRTRVSLAHHPEVFDVGPSMTDGVAMAKREQPGNP